MDPMQKSTQGHAVQDQAFGLPPEYNQTGSSHLYANQNQYGQPMQTTAVYGVQQHTVVLAQPVHTTTIIQAPPRPSNYMGLAIFTCLCFNMLFGGIAIIFSIMSSSSADSGDRNQATTYGKVSMGLSISGIIMSAIAVVIVVVYFVAIVGSRSFYYVG